MKTLFRLALVLVIGVVAGYVLHPTISNKLEGTKVQKVIDSFETDANTYAESKLNSKSE